VLLGSGQCALPGRRGVMLGCASMLERDAGGQGEGTEQEKNRQSV
jgi:hypothetical protein